MIPGPYRNIALIGFMGAGKSTLAGRLAERLGWQAADSDAEIEREAGKPVARVFAEDGEAAFRELERVEVTRALAEERGVVALGGGAPVQPGAAELLEGHTVVFLDVGIADASKRIGFDQSRPLLAVNPRASWVAMMNVRRALYEAVATLRANTAGRTPEDVAAEVASALAVGRPGPGAAP
jgi:shikimate kinase